MKKMLIPALLAALLLFAACNKTPGESVTPPQNSGAGAEQPSSGADTNAPKPFASGEVEDIFRMTEDEMTAKFGQPLNKTKDEDSGLRTVEYGDATVLFGDGYIARVEIRSDAIPAIRGVKIGDSVETVREKFPDEAQEPFHPQDNDPYNYVVLYGEYVHMSFYGVLHRDGDTAYAIELADNDFSVTFHFAENKLDSVTYLLAA
ncbi:MAG: hypothetical protein AB7C89_05055 [Intestinibacillus sp.]